MDIIFGKKEPKFDFLLKQSFVSGVFDNFGSSIAMNNDSTIIVIGSDSEDVVSEDGGATYIYTGNSEIGWTLKQKILNDGSGPDGFGRSAGINYDGSIIAIGAHRDSQGGVDAGAVFIYTGNAVSGWTLKQKIIGESYQGGDRLGESLTINNEGNIILVGAENSNLFGLDSGGGKVFTGNAQVGWSLKSTLSPPTSSPFANFGLSVGASKDFSVITVNAPSDDSVTFNGGSVLIYTGNAQQGWNFKQKLIGQSWDGRFGINTDLNSNGSILVVGMAGESSSDGPGSIFIYTGNSQNNWVLKQQIDNDAGRIGDVKINNDGNIIYASNLSNERILIYTGNSQEGWDFHKRISGSGFQRFPNLEVSNSGSNILVTKSSFSASSVLMYTNQVVQEPSSNVFFKHDYYLNQSEIKFT
jgi:hypothetical protein